MLSVLQELLGVAFQYQQEQLLQRLLSAVLGSAAEDSAPAETGTASAPVCPCLAAAAAVLDGVMKVQDAPGRYLSHWEVDWPGSPWRSATCSGRGTA